MPAPCTLLFVATETLSHCELKSSLSSKARKICHCTHLVHRSKRLVAGCKLLILSHEGNELKCRSTRYVHRSKHLGSGYKLLSLLHGGNELKFHRSKPLVAGCKLMSLSGEGNKLKLVSLTTPLAEADISVLMIATYSTNY